MLGREDSIATKFQEFLEPDWCQEFLKFLEPDWCREFLKFLKGPGAVPRPCLVKVRRLEKTRHRAENCRIR